MTHKPNDITKAQVKAMSKYLPQKYIAEHLDITEKTLRKHYRQELNAGAHEMNLQLAKTAFEMAVYDKDRAVLIFLLKTRLGMAEVKWEKEDDTEVGDELDITFNVAEPVKDIRVTKGE